MNPADTEKALHEASERLDRAAIAMEKARQELIDAAADYAMSSQAHRYALENPDRGDATEAEGETEK